MSGILAMLKDQKSIPPTWERPFWIGVIVIVVALLLAVVAIAAAIALWSKPFREKARDLYSKEELYRQIGGSPISFGAVPRPFLEAFQEYQEPRFNSYNTSVDWWGYSQVLLRQSNNPPRALCFRLSSNTWSQHAEVKRFQPLRKAILLRFLAIEIERNLTKDEILFFALNSFRFSPTEEGGVEAGARYHFAEEIEDLTPMQQRVLAFISINPEFRTPENVTEALKLTAPNKKRPAVSRRSFPEKIADRTGQSRPQATQ